MTQDEQSMTDPPDDDAAQAGFQFLQNAFATVTTTLAANLNSSQRIIHAGDRGETNEKYFIDLLRLYLPNRYTVEKAMVLDSTGATSDSLDVVVFDRQFTPTLLDSHKHRYVPAEAVYAVFECKPAIDKQNLQYAGRKAASVRKLVRTTASIPVLRGAPEPKAPPDIIAGILAIRASWADGLGASFTNCQNELSGLEKLDCGLAVEHGAYDTHAGELAVHNQPGQSVAMFVFRLLDALRNMGNAPAADWNAYATAITTRS